MSETPKHDVTDPIAAGIEALVVAARRVGNDRARYPRSVAVQHAEALETAARTALAEAIERRGVEC